MNTQQLEELMRQVQKLSPRDPKTLLNFAEFLQ
jgi:hypothetical protein